MNDRKSPSPRDTPRRTEPVLGNLDQVDAGADHRGHARPEPAAPPTRHPPAAHHPRRPPASGGRRRVRWWVVALVFVLVGAGAWIATHQATLQALLPPTQLNTLLTRADGALAVGNLDGGPDSARDLYLAARALDPDNERALDGLQKVGKAELAQARAALQRNDYSAARSALENARGLLGGGADVEAVDKELAKAVLRSANTEVLIDQARAALANGRIDGSDGAAALFGKVLAGDPQNAVARHGMDRIGNLLAGQVTTQLAKQDRAGARQTLARLSSLLPRYAQLPSLRASVAAADRAADARRDQYLAQGEADLRAGRATGFGDANAEARFKAALAIDPDSVAARDGLGRVAAALVGQANAAIATGNVQQATALLDQAAGLAPGLPEIAAARAHLQAGGVPTVATTPATGLTPAQSAKLARLVARGHAAARRGDIMLPPGDSAYDLYRAALGIDGDNADAQAGLRALPKITRDQFQQALRSGNLQHAQDMLATLEQLDPGDPSADGMRRQLGGAWIDRAGDDAASGRVAAARTALDEARQLVPRDPRIAELDARIHQDR